MTIQKFYRLFLPLLCLALALTLTIGSVQASPVQQTDADFAAIDAYVQDQMENLGFPGIALGIVQDGQIAHLEGFGVADSSGREVIPQTPFYIGSITKSFTALAVMQLVEAGEIDLDSPVQDYLPWFTLADADASAQITVRHLLNQSSGISTKDGNRFWNSQQGPEEFVRGLDTVQLSQPVGTSYQYCNINFILAGLIVESVSGQSYTEYVSDHIFAPLDMRHSYASRDLALTDGLSGGHYYMFGRVFRDERGMPPAGLAAGGLMISAEDMAHYLIAQLNEGRYGDAAVLSPQGMNELHAPAIPMERESYYALGWNVGTWEDTTIIGHNGDPGNFHANVVLLPEQGSGFVLLANASGFVQLTQVDQIAVGIARLLTDRMPDSISMPFTMRFLYWGILLTPLLQIAGIVFVWRKRRRMKCWTVILTVALNLGVVAGLYAFSLSIPFQIPSMGVFFPEVAYGLIVVIALGIGWSLVLSTAYLFRRRVTAPATPGGRRVQQIG